MRLWSVFNHFNISYFAFCKKMTNFATIFSKNRKMLALGKYYFYYYT